MAIVLKRLHGILAKDKRDSSPEICEELPKGSYLAYLETQPAVTKRAFFKLLVEEDASLVLEYNSLRAFLEKILSEPDFDEAKVTLLVQEALDLAMLIDIKYHKYINERPNLRRSKLQAHQEIYRHWLRQNGPASANRSNAAFPFVGEIRSYTENTQPYRLSFMRMRRFLRELIPIINNFEHYGSWVIWADGYIAPILTYLSLVFFIPRLLCSMLMLWVPVSDYSYMTHEEKTLWSAVHFNAQWERLWPNLTNDIAWTVSGALMCFVCIGSLQPTAVYLTLMMQFHDAVMSCLRTYLELGRLNDLLENYRTIPNSSPDYQLICDYLLCLEAGVEREKTLLYLSVVNFFGLLLAAGLYLPFVVAVSPLLPVLGAIIALSMTAINFGGRHYLTQQTPHWLAEYMMKGINASGLTLFTPHPADGLDQLLRRDKAHPSTPSFINPSEIQENNQSRSALFASTSVLASQGFLASMGRSRSFPPNTQSPTTIATSMSGEIALSCSKLNRSPKSKYERTSSYEWASSIGADFFIGDYAPK